MRAPGSPRARSTARALDRHARRALRRARRRATVCARRFAAPRRSRRSPASASTHESEALPGALPRRQNAPRRGPFGLYPELLNGTPFTVRSAENSRVWMYRVRAVVLARRVRPAARRRASPRRSATSNPNRTRWRPLPIPRRPRGRLPRRPGHARRRRRSHRAARATRVHLYAANADMIDRSLLERRRRPAHRPADGTLECRTELGWLRVRAGLGRRSSRAAIKFAIGFADGGARAAGCSRSSAGVCACRSAAPSARTASPTRGTSSRRRRRTRTAVPGGLPDRDEARRAQLFAATQEHSPFDVVAWHGNHAPFSLRSLALQRRWAR